MLAIVAIEEGRRPNAKANAKAFARSATTRSMFGSTFKHKQRGDPAACDPVRET
jgi:hypothetical protein